MYVKTNLNCTEINDFATVQRDYEVLTVKNSKCVYCGIYRHPKGDISCFLKFIDDLFVFIGENNITLFLGGDSNLDMLSSSPRQLEFFSLYKSYGYFNLISRPTRITPLKETLHDLFLTNADESHVSLEPR